MNRLLLCLLLTAIAGRASDSCAQPGLVWRLRSVSEPQAQPGGKLVVYVESWNDETADRAFSELRLVQADGSGGRALTAGKQRATGPAWSPDGKRIAYVSDRGGQSRIYLVTVAGGAETAIAVNGTPANLAWSPDGTRIAYTSFVAANERWDPPMPKPPAGAKWAAPAVAVSNLRWTLDGTGLLKPGGVRIHVVPAAGGTSRQVTPESYQHTSYLAEPEFQWSRDGRSIVAPAVKGADGWAVYTGNQIYGFPVDDQREPEQLTTGEGHKSQLRVSPDGSRLAFAAYAWKGQSYHVNHLQVLELQSRRVTPLTPSWDRDVSTPVWSPDSQQISFLSEDRGSVNVYRTDLTGKQEPLTSGMHRLAGLVGGGEGLLATYSTTTEPASIALISKGTVRRIADANSRLGCRFVPAEEIWYRSFDGAKIQGWVVKPPGFDASKRYPLVVMIHGGPHGAYGASFSDEFQTLAAQGYIVLYTNPRGSTGYGESFGNVIQHKWPGDDIKDVLAGVDHLVSTGMVDASRMAVMGGSGGGLMTAWTITQTDRFRAAVALYPVTNWITHVGTGDNGFYIASVYRKGMPWDYPKDYMSHSPLFYVNRVKTPTMIVTGDADWRTPIAQSEEFYRALKVRGIDTVFVRVPGESHGIRKFPSHRVQVMAHILAWLGRYLAPVAPPA